MTDALQQSRVIPPRRITQSRFPSMKRSASFRFEIVVLLFAAIHAHALTAQSARDTARVDTTRRQQTLFTPADLALAAGFAGLTVAMFPADRSIAQRLENESSKANQFLDRSATGFELITSPGAFIIGPALYAYGRLGKHPGVQDLGLHGTEAVLLGSGVTGLLKGLLGRSRLYVSADTNRRGLRLGKRFAGSDRASFSAPRCLMRMGRRACDRTVEPRSPRRDIVHRQCTHRWCPSLIATEHEPP